MIKIYKIVIIKTHKFNMEINYLECQDQNKHQIN